MTMMHTTCPSCHAVFRIKPEQLDAHAGKVRCGKCAYVFNGFETLITPLETVSFMAPYDEDEDGDEEIVQAAPRKLEKFSLDSRTTAFESIEIYSVRPITVMESLSGSFPLQTDEQITHEAEEINRAIAATTHPDLIKEEVPKEKTIKPGLQITPELHAKLNHLQQQLSDEQTHARWRFWGWSAGLLILFLLLAGQSIYFFRNTIAAYYPESKPLLSNACRVLGCTVEMLTNINLIKLDGVELQAMPDHPNIVTFSASLRNSAAYRQRYPILELTLTDITNQALARRHFAPEEYLPKTLPLAQGLPMQEEIPIKITLDLHGLEAVGYKSRVFFP